MNKRHETMTTIADALQAGRQIDICVFGENGSRPATEGEVKNALYSIAEGRDFYAENDGKGRRKISIGGDRVLFVSLFAVV